MLLIRSYLGQEGNVVLAVELRELLVGARSWTKNLQVCEGHKRERDCASCRGGVASWDGSVRNSFYQPPHHSSRKFVLWRPLAEARVGYCVGTSMSVTRRPKDVFFHIFVFFCIIIK